MTSDSLKSLGFLKKSLRMNAKAMKNNLAGDGIPAAELTAFIDHAKAMVQQIETWEKAATPATPAGIVQPAPAAATVSTVPDPDDDLLTVP
jgi:hypothetical protein